MVQTRSARKGAGDRLALSRHEQLAGCPLCLPKRVAAPHCVGGQAGIRVHLQPVAVHCERVAARRAVVLEGVLPSASLAACLKAGTPPPFQPRNCSRDTGGPPRSPRRPLDAVACCCSLFLLTCAPPMTSSRSKAALPVRPAAAFHRCDACLGASASLPVRRRRPAWLVQPNV